MDRFETGFGENKTLLVNQVADYYAARASEYSDTSSAVITDDDRELKDAVQQVFAGRDVLEVACGNGKWTRIIAGTARSILATDVNPGMISAGLNSLNPDTENVQFRVADAYSLRGVDSGFSGAFAGLWWCFIPIVCRKTFLSCLHGKLLPGARVFFFCQLEDSDAGNHSFADGDKIATRIAEGREFRIVKNIPTEAELASLLEGVAENVEYSRYSNGMWSITYIFTGDGKKNLE